MFVAWPVRNECRWCQVLAVIGWELIVAKKLSWLSFEGSCTWRRRVAVKESVEILLCQLTLLHSRYDPPETRATYKLFFSYNTTLYRAWCAILMNNTTTLTRQKCMIQAVNIMRQTKILFSLYSGSPLLRLQAEQHEGTLSLLQISQQVTLSHPSTADLIKEQLGLWREISYLDPSCCSIVPTQWPHPIATFR